MMSIDSRFLPDAVLRKMKPEDRAALGGLLPGERMDICCAKIEKELQRDLFNFLRCRDIACNVSRMDKAKTDVVGWPDFAFAVNGRAIAFECKIAGRKLTEEQLRIKEHMERNGWCYWVISSLEQARDIVNALMSAKEWK